jgi:hypothetical protein
MEGAGVAKAADLVEIYLQKLENMVQEARARFVKKAGD